MRRTISGAALVVATLIPVQAAAQAPPLRFESAAEVPPGTPGLPRPRAWDPSQPVPPGYHVERRPRKGLLIAGALVSAATHVAMTVPSLLIATDSRSDPSAALAMLPVGGPAYFIYQLSKPSSGGDGTGLLVAYLDVALVIDALGQAAGIGMLIGGAMGKPVLVPGERVGRAPTAPTVAPVPVRLGQSGAGLGVVGAF